jgi:hypothetical protein
VSETAAQKWSTKMTKTTEEANKPISAQGVRYAFQEARLQGSRALLVMADFFDSIEPLQTGEVG